MLWTTIMRIKELLILGKNSTLIFSLFSSHHIADEIAKTCGFEKIDVIQQSFPDGETYIQYNRRINGNKIIIVDTLNTPNEKILPLIFAAETAKDLGAKEIGLIAPYLCYMRQDKRFQSGEAITSKIFAKFISQTFDWMLTIDPHLHRYKSLDEIYTIPTKVISAATTLSTWIKCHVPLPLLIGPDQESEQWISQIAQNINCPFRVLDKKRLSSHEVQISIPNIENFMDHSPVLVDDIVSTGQTMIKTIEHLKSLGTKPPTCVIVHPIFADITMDTLLQAGAARVVSSNTIPHASNVPDLDISKVLIEGMSFDMSLQMD